MKRWVKFYLAITAIILGFQLPWVKLAPGSREPIQHILDAGDYIADRGIPGHQIPNHLSEGGLGFLLNILALFGVNTELMRMLSWLVYLIPSIAVIWAIQYPFKRRKRDFNQQLCFVGIGLFTLFFVKIILALYTGELAHFRPGYGLWICMLAYLYIGFLGIKKL